MPIRIPNQLPAKEILQQEKIFIMDEQRAITQDIRELKIAILNLMPIKQETEVQLLRLLGNTPLQIDITLLRLSTHQSRNTCMDYLETFYKTFDTIKEEKFDGMIITGAPIEQIPFEEVDYWDEIETIMAWSKDHVTSTFHICWGAQAGLYYHYGIQKYPLEQKKFGIYEHEVLGEAPLLKGLDDCVHIPHSRHTTILKEDILAHSELRILLESKEAGPALVVSKDGKQIFATGHSEYDSWTLAKEYERDLGKHLSIDMPYNYYKENDMTKGVKTTWRSHGYILFSNWLNYYVYQKTPYDLDEIR